MATDDGAGPISGLSVFGGTGFIGGQFVRNSKHATVVVPREERHAETRDLLYLISTTDNYNVFDDPLRDARVNIDLLLEVLKGLDRKRQRINFVSSWFVYGDVTLPAHEESHCEPKGFYSITKRAAEQLLISYCQTFQVPYRILRLCNVYGEADRGTSPRKNALQYLIGQLREHQDVGLYYGGEFCRDYLCVDDVVRALDIVVERAPWNTTINVGAGEPVVFREIIELARTVLQSRSRVTAIEPTPFHRIVQVKDFFMDTGRLKGLGFVPQVPIREGIAQLCRR